MRRSKHEDPLTRWRKRKRYERFGAAVLVLVCLGGLLWLDRAGWISPWFGREGQRVAQRQRDLRRLGGRYVRVRRITRQLDFKLISRAGPGFSARLLGVRPRPDDDRRAAALAEYLTAERWLTVRLDPGLTRDASNRLRLDLILADGQSLTERLLLAGVVRVRDEPDERPRHRRAERFQLLERQAKIRGDGMWEDPD